MRRTRPGVNSATRRPGAGAIAPDEPEDPDATAVAYRSDPPRPLGALGGGRNRARRGIGGGNTVGGEPRGQIMGADRGFRSCFRVLVAGAALGLVGLPACESDGGGGSIPFDIGGGSDSVDDAVADTPGQDVAPDPGGGGEDVAAPDTGTQDVAPDPGVDAGEDALPDTGTQDVAPDLAVDGASDTAGDQGDAGGAPPIPTEATALQAWLDEGHYLDWPAESAPHTSAGPHFGTVHVYVSPELEASLDAGDAQHPAGAAAVKELYSGGSEILGHAVSVKKAADSAGGDNWYWYERYQGSVLADGDGVGACTGCHSAGDDFVLTGYPLQ